MIPLVNRRACETSAGPDVWTLLERLSRALDRLREEVGEHV